MALQQTKQIYGISQLQSMYKAKGVAYIISWLHRISGVLLILYVLIHINTLASLTRPEEFAQKAQMFSGFFPMTLEWLLAVPVIFHALNGGRLLLYELFGTRWDKRILSWVIALAAGYMLILGYFMVLGNQQVSAHFFWLNVVICSGIISYIVITKISKTRASIAWKLQRISAAFMFLVVPSHMLFMHLNHQVGRDPQIILERMNQPFIKFVDILLLLSILYHGGYGLLGIGNDYMSAKRKGLAFTILVVLILVLFAFKGIYLIAAI